MRQVIVLLAVVACSSEHRATLPDAGVDAGPSPPSPCAGAVGFPGGPVPQLGGSPGWFAVGDLDGDGVPDFVVSYAGLLPIGVVRGSHDGKFLAERPFTTGHLGGPVVIADVDGDGKRDIVMFGNDAFASVLLGNGDGSFQVPRDTAITANVRAFAVADFDGDGHLDLAIAEPSYVDVMLGRGDGTFQPAVQYSAAEEPAVAAVDVSGDGHIDLLLSAPTNGQLGVLLGNGNGTFAPEQDVATPVYVQAIVAADFDGDGKIDVVASGVPLVAGPGEVVLMHGGGNGTFQPGVVLPGASDAYLAADLDGDGNTDLVAPDGALLGNGHGGFAFAAHNWPVSAFALIDLDGNGHLDLCGLGSGALVIGHNDGHGILELPGAFSPGPVANSIALADFDRNGTLADPMTLPMTANTSAIAAGDLDGDGAADLVVIDGYPQFGSVDVLAGRGNGTFATLSSGFSAQLTLALADVDGDGVLDAIGDGTSTISIAHGNGDHTFAAGATFGMGAGTTSVALGDFDGNGSVDIAAATRVPIGNGDGSFETGVEVLLGDGHGGFATKTSTMLDPEGGLNSIGAGDLDGDGKLDLVVNDDYTGTVSILHGNGDGTFAAPVRLSTGPAAMGISPNGGRELAVADVTSDGKLDLVIAHSARGVVSIFVGRGDGTFADRVDYAGGGTSVALGDLDGDGRLDVVTPGAVLLQRCR